MNEIDRFLSSDQENEMSVQNPKPNEGMGRNNDQLAHDPKNTSKKMSMSDEQEILPSDDNSLEEAAEDAAKKPQCSIEHQ